MTKKIQIFLFLVPLLLLAWFNCQSPPKDNSAQNKKDTLTYLNHSDSAKYVGMNTCKLCHQNIYNTFIHTGMGKSFDHATKTKSSGDFKNAEVYDKLLEMHYRAFWEKDSLFIEEFRLDKKDTVHHRIEQVNYIIGSGQHTNSHLQTVNGYINQMPMTFYTQKKHWDLPPGFENGVNTRFSRKIGLECMSCHNAYPDFVMGSENKFKSVPNGIDCERCHGPGSIHVEQRRSGSRVDTSKYIDYSIVNPGKLQIDRQFDVCQRCHLQGNAVLKEGNSFYDFKPGQKLSDYISVFLPKYKNADDEFIMASHADRLKQSQCFIQSFKEADKSSLRPYKKAMTCVTCHNPHVSVKETNRNVFNDACTNCHSDDSALQKDHASLRNKKWDDCVSCHMPVSGSTDIPHVSVHDHFIRKPVTQKEKKDIKAFLGLFSINEPSPDALTKAQAYIDQYEKFEQKGHYLDSALRLLNSVTDKHKSVYPKIQLYFIKGEYAKIISLIEETGEEKCLDSLFINRSYNNRDAWATYRVAESYNNVGRNTEALKWFKHAVKLAPYNLDYRNKLGSALAAANRLKEAIAEFEYIISENPKFVSAYSNLGYIRMIQGSPAEALRLYYIGKKLDPDNESLLLNLAGYYLYNKENKIAREYLEKIVKKNPHNKSAAEALKRI